MCQGLPWWLSWKRICLQCRRPWFNSWVRKFPWRRNRLPTPVFLGFSCNSDGKETACNAGNLDSVPGLGRSLEEGMATHSSILAWRIPLTEEPGGLQPMGLQRVGHNWVTQHTALSVDNQCSLLFVFHRDLQREAEGCVQDPNVWIFYLF